MAATNRKPQHPQHPQQQRQRVHDPPIAWATPSTATTSAARGPGLRRAMAATASSAAKAASTTTPTPTPAMPSRWKELRQSVRVKATMETSSRRGHARIADLCDEDREKVAKLIRRIVDVTAAQEARETEWQRERAQLESQLLELREHVTQDLREVDALREELAAAQARERTYQQRVLVLEDSNERETKRRMDADETMDLLKVCVCGWMDRWERVSSAACW
ncbi:hypothetical protein PINS_up009750 [Pythium insidiosum]|nr:hypothetical protein PINS_up009750 [Pythium insidiosum]